MTTQATSPGPPLHAGVDTLTAAIGDLRSRMSALQTRPEHGTPDELELALGALEVAVEELHVADEELRAQRGELQRLIDMRGSDQVRRERLWGALPLPVMLTDLAGTILEANSRAAVAVGSRGSPLIRKPLQSCLEGDDRRNVRNALSELGRGANLRRVSLRLRRRDGSETPVRMLALRDATTSQPAVRWVAVPADEGGLDEAEAEWVTSTVSLFRSPVEEDGVPGLTHRIAALAGSIVPGADGASMTLGPPSAPYLRVTDAGFAQSGDGIQVAAGQGPSWEAFTTGRPCHTPDASGPGPWPRLVLHARRVGVRDVLAVPIAGEDGFALGVLTAYARVAGSLGRRSETLLHWLAAAGGSLLRDVQERENLRQLASQLEIALNSRGVIEQAKGMVMATSRCTPEEAFKVLAEISKRENIKVREIARRLVERLPLHDV
jgi:PAS domain-containing protein